jgi:Na+-transporting NADH:ubiquinone oxidoreductase subunit NqrA
VVEQSPGVTVEIVDLDAKEVSAEPTASMETLSENGQTGFLTLTRLANRLSYIITDLNGLISAVVNDEVTPADLAGKFGALVLKLDLLETAVHELEDLFWR